MSKAWIQLGKDLQATNQCGSALRFKTSQEAQLLGALMLAMPGELDRIRLARAIWPQADSRLAQQSLRQRLCDLRTTIGGHIDADRTAIALHDLPHQLIVDSSASTDPTSLLNICQRLCDAAKIPSIDDNNWNKGWWLERRVEAILAGESVSTLTKDVLSALFLSLTTTELDIDEKILRLVVLTNEAAGDTDQSRLLSEAILLSESCPPDRGLHAAMAFVCKCCSALCHRLGQWHQSICFEQQGVLHAENADDAQLTRWANFRVIRKQIDLNLTRENYSQLNAFQQRPDLDPELAAYVDMNLVYAHAARGDIEQGQMAATRCRSRNLIQGDVDVQSWLSLNEAQLTLNAGRPRGALDSLTEAHLASRGRAAPIDHLWHWAVGAQVFAVMENVETAAMLYTLSERARRFRGAAMSPTNSRTLSRFMAHAADSSSPTRWLKAVADAEAMPLGDAHSFYCERLKEASRSVRN